MHDNIMMTFVGYIILAVISIFIVGAITYTIYEHIKKKKH